MSKSRGCIIAEIEPNVWWALVAVREYDYEFDECEAYGPCGTAAAARELMHSHTSNPGGSQTEYNDQLSERTKAIFESAQKWSGSKRMVKGGGWIRSGPITFGGY